MGGLGGVASEDMEIAYIDNFEIFGYEHEKRNRVLAGEGCVVQGGIFLLKIIDHIMCSRE